MILSKEKIKEFKALSQPLMDWLDTNCHPHCSVHLDSSRAEVVEGMAAFTSPKYMEDVQSGRKS